VVGIDLPSDCLVLGEQDARSYELADVLNRASMLILLDPFSFPLEVMAGDHWNVPMVVVLPSGLEAESLTNTAIGSVLFERLTFFDRIVTPDSALWGELRRRYRWAEDQRLPVASRHPSEVAAEACALFETESHDLRSSKAVHRVQTAALEPRFVAAREKRDAKVPVSVLQVGAGVGYWVSSFDSAKTRFVGLDGDEDLVRTARATFPDQRFDFLDSDLHFPYDDESFDLVFSVTFMHHNPAPAKRTLLSEMWRVARPGGRLLFLENFVFTSQQKKSAIYPMSVTEFMNLILDATVGQVVLEHVESLRYPQEDQFTGGLVSLLRLGVPKCSNAGRSVAPH
jgi:ubiquinone/menaquinone biosynthesis C-methylase UbiE